MLIEYTSIAYKHKQQQKNNRRQKQIITLQTQGLPYSPKAASNQAIVMLFIKLFT